MALIIEDGTGKADAQSYASVDQLKAYAAARGITIPTKLASLESMLIAAMDELRGRDFIGSRATKAQALDWPRECVRIEGFDYAADEIPALLLDAQCELAIASQTVKLQPVIPTDSIGQVVEETVGELTTKYADTGRRLTRPVVAAAEACLRKLTRGGGTASLRLERA